MIPTQLIDGHLLQGGRYHIERCISTAGLGFTYIGQHQLLKKRVIIREFFLFDCFHRDLQSGLVTLADSVGDGQRDRAQYVSEQRALFLAEAKAVPVDTLVKVHDIFEENSTLYYVMDYIEQPGANGGVCVLISPNGATARLPLPDVDGCVMLSGAPPSAPDEVTEVTVLVDEPTAAPAEPTAAPAKAPAEPTAAPAAAPAEPTAPPAVPAEAPCRRSVWSKYKVAIIAAILAFAASAGYVVYDHYFAKKSYVADDWDDEEEEDLYDAETYLWPSVSDQTDSLLFVHQVILTPEHTYVDFITYNHGAYAWCNINPKSYLTVDGRRYTLTKAEGIALAPDHTDYPVDSLHYFAKLYFRLTFPALPAGTTQFGFYEPNSDWSIPGIYLKSAKPITVDAERFATDSHYWQLLSIERRSDCTVLTKRVTPRVDGTYFYSVPEEYIEDSATGRKYYIQNSTLGFASAPSSSLDTDPLIFTEVYPPLPSSVRRVSVSNGTRYYATDIPLR